MHAEQAEAAPVGVVHLDRIEPHAVVLDDQRYLIRPALENDFDVAGPCVFGDVVERFLGDPVQRRFDLRSESLRRQPSGVELDGHGHANRPGWGEVG